ncbi:cell division protein FtsQ/DivIB [Chakrabartyella piscis]|uniref:cell division protein FtsQ/DivIB n=1 Tax=Chakrabartyella piscis TaxID=2918914 RepID=UPI002958BB51|nr:FtsQ-type POTRA domain-containing protein [Chakrabartyella piscis]
MNQNENDYDLIYNIQMRDELDYPSAPSRRKRPKKEPIRQKVLIGCLVVLCLLIGLLFSPLFTTKYIYLEGCERYSLDEICDTISFHTGDNLVLYNRSKAEKTLLTDPYIATADISLKLPSTMTITLTERLTRGYVPYMGAYLYIDMEGRVLETQSSYSDPLPIVNGLQFTSFQLGELLPVQNQEALTVMLQISKLMEKYELLDLILEVDVSDANNIVAYTNGVQVYLGNIDRMDQKIRYLSEIVPNIPTEDRGSLDLSDLDKPLIFQYLT